MANTNTFYIFNIFNMNISIIIYIRISVTIINIIITIISIIIFIIINNFDTLITSIATITIIINR
jgi:hypothetical protein